jgi:UDP-3-O-[3-hydroxymyristoyl] N-acetylglucosamine deacetylase
MPIIDGSAKYFAELFEKVGMQKQKKVAKILTLSEPVYFTENYVTLVALPSDEYKISFTIHHPQNAFLNTQYYSYSVQKKTYIKNIAPARTYSIYEEIKPLLDNNLIKGGSLDNAVVIKDNKVLNPEGIRFSDEMVRHKVLDLMGDLRLIPERFFAHIVAIRSGHLTNVRFAKKLIKILRSNN